MNEWAIGIIGGSGLYQIDGIADAQWISVDTPWGAPSDALLIGYIGDVKFVFLPRHGRGHRLSPTNLHARANIDALKRDGCTHILSISAVGSMRQDNPPGRLVIAHPFTIRPLPRETSFYGAGNADQR